MDGERWMLKENWADLREETDPADKNQKFEMNYLKETSDAVLATKAKTLDERAVTRDVYVGKVSEQTTTLTNEQQQSTTRVVVVLVLLEVLRQVKDAPREKCDLNLGGTRVTGVRCVFFDDHLFDVLFKCHSWDPLSYNSLRGATNLMLWLSLSAAVRRQLPKTTRGADRV